MAGLGLKYEHQGISVEDMEETIKWYETVFDAKVISDENSSDFGAPLNCRVVHMIAEGAHFELFKYLGEDGQHVSEIDKNSVTTLRVCGNKHVCYEINLPKFVREKVIPNNVWIDHGPEKQGDNWQMFIMDPNGVLYEFHDTGGAVREPHAFDDFPCKLFD